MAKYLIGNSFAKNQPSVIHSLKHMTHSFKYKAILEKKIHPEETDLSEPGFY